MLLFFLLNREKTKLNANIEINQNFGVIYRKKLFGGYSLQESHIKPL